MESRERAEHGHGDRERRQQYAGADDRHERLGGGSDEYERAVQHKADQRERRREPDEIDGGAGHPSRSRFMFCRLTDCLWREAARVMGGPDPASAAGTGRWKRRSTPPPPPQPPASAANAGGTAVRP